MVKEIQLAFDDKRSRFLVPVTIELEPDIFLTLTGEHIDQQDLLSMSQLVENGLRAQLQIQSFLTGQLYVHLDFYPEKAARFVRDDPETREIPSIPTTVKELTSMLEDFPTTEFLADLAAISASTNKLLASEAVHNIPNQLEATLVNLEALTARLEAASEPLVTETEENLLAMRQAIDAVDVAMVKVGKAADQVEALTDVDSQLYGNIKQVSTELTMVSETLRHLVDEESPTVQHLNRSLREISRAARALRLLAESMEREPEAVWRGKGGEEEK